jgi:Protein of unknown function (DUF2889)
MDDIDRSRTGISAGQDVRRVGERGYVADMEPVIFRGTITESRGHLPPADRPVWEGTTGPIGSTPRRRPNSIRRTSSIDIIWPDTPARLVLRGRGRDVLTGTDEHDIDVVDEGDMTITLAGPLMTIEQATLVPDQFGVASWLIGQKGHFRLRSMIDRQFPDFVASGSVAALLVDEIPAATLISGSSLGRSGLIRHSGRGPAPDVCAGWISEGSMHKGLATRPFFGEGPPAPSLDRDGDPLAWHARPDLPPGSMRRCRRIDVFAADRSAAQLTVEVFFRDSFIEPDGMETAVHEYGIDLTIDRRDLLVTSIAATPHVLPSPECPSAAASALRIAGMPVSEIRGHVRDQFRGTTTCTHLNDALRSAGDLGALIAHIR